MTPALDGTHDPKLRSWLESANRPGNDFPIQNLPFGAFRRAAGEPTRLGIAIGDRVLDLAGAVEDHLLPELEDALRDALCAPLLNPLLALGPPAWSRVRSAVSQLLSVDTGTRLDPGRLPARADVRLELPVGIGDYTDFYASIHHATNVGRMFRPEQPLLPNYKYLPIGYHGRASSLIPSGTTIRRPRGQRKLEGEAVPTFGPTERLDYECEVGLVIGSGNRLGEPIPIERAGEHIFGYCLVNDWSARDIQQWEYQPLGPFLGKSFATSLSPWIVTSLALAPFRGPAAARPAEDPAPLPYLLDPQDQRSGGVDIGLEVWLATERMRDAGIPPVRFSRSSFLSLYWTPAQLVAHHASNGCNLRPGDVLASGTVSDPAEDSVGCLLELTVGGTRPIRLPTGEERRFLADGDEVILRGTCAREGRVTMGFGECGGTVIG